MAYVFNSVNQQLEDQKSNIFNNQPASQQPSGQTGAGGYQKTQAQGGMSGGSAQAPKAPAQPNMQKTQDSLKKASERAKTPDAITGLQPKIQQAQQGVQAEADKYVQNAQAKNYNLDQSQLESAAGGDEEALKTVGQRLHSTADVAERFKPETQTNFQEIQDIQTDPGIRNMYKKQVGPQYGRGESAFDSMLLQRNPEFQKLRASLQQDQQGLSQNVAGLQESKTKEAQDALTGNFNRDISDIKGRLGGLGEGVVNSATERAKAINARRAGLDVAGTATTREQELAKALQEEMSPGGKSLQGRAAALLSDPSILGSVNEGDFIKRGKEVGYGDVLEQGEADKYNRIMSLLDQNKSLQAGAGAGEDISEDIGGLRGALQSAALTKRQKMDADQQAKLAAARQQLGGSATLRQQTRDQEIQNQVKDYVTRALRDRIGGAAAMNPGQAVTGQQFSADPFDQKSSYYNDPLSVNARALISNPGQLGQVSNYGQNLDWRSMLNSDQANEYNTINQDLGLEPQFKAGNMGDGGVDFYKIAQMLGVSGSPASMNMGQALGTGGLQSPTGVRTY